MLKIAHEKSHPGVPETNAIIERCNQTILRGMRAALFAAGLPLCFWTYAGACFCMLDNIADGDGYVWEFLKRNLGKDDEVEDGVNPKREEAETHIELPVTDEEMARK